MTEGLKDVGKVGSLLDSCELENRVAFLRGETKGLLEVAINHRGTMEGLLPTTKTRSFLLLLVLLLLLATASATRRGSSRRQRQCPGVPDFRVNNVEPMAVAQGQVTLVALLTSNCPFCISQSERLQELYEELQNNESQVHMMIINGGPRPAPGRQGIFEQRVSFPVYHDDDDRTIWNQVFQGSKDDIFILDRCGLRAFRIPFPYSYLGYSYVQRGLQRVLHHSVCPNCPGGSSGLQDRMMGDDPGLPDWRSMTRPGRFEFGRNPQSRARVFGRRGRGSGRSHRHRNLNRSRCPRNDIMCRELRQAKRRYNRYRSQHGIHLHPGMREEEILGIFERSQRRGMGPVF